MLLANTNQPVYTEWWVNGPLSNGSPVQILQGWSSVTGSENLDLGTAIGPRSGWIVTSQLSQTINTNIPNPSNPLSSATSTTSANLNLLWSYDQTADLLLRTSDSANVTSQSTNTVEIFPAGCFPPSPTCIPTSVTVTRNMSLSLKVALRLTSTNISLTTPKTRSGRTLTDMLASAPWMPLSLGVVVAGVVAGIIALITRRTRGKNVPAPVETGPPSTMPTPTT